MNKRGQIYLLASIIIGLVIFVLASKTNIINITPTNNDFKEITENYNSESGKVMGELIKSGKSDSDVSLNFASFSVLFTQYSKTKNPSFGLIYFLNYNGILRIGNFLDQGVKIITPTNTEISLQGCFSQLPASISYGEFQQTFYRSLSYFQSGSAYAECIREIPAPSFINLQIGDEQIDYRVDILANQPQVAVISRASSSQDRKVFVDHQFIRGNRH